MASRFIGVLALGLVMSASASLGGQQKAVDSIDIPPPVAIAARAVSGAPRVDGVMDDLVWQLGPIELPPRQADVGYVRPPMEDQTVVSDVYGELIEPASKANQKADDDKSVTARGAPSAS